MFLLFVENLPLTFPESRRCTVFESLDHLITGRTSAFILFDRFEALTVSLLLVITLDGLF